MKKGQIRTVIAASRQGQISWVSGWAGGGQGIERRKDNLELEQASIIKQASRIHCILIAVQIIVTVLPL